MSHSTAELPVGMAGLRYPITQVSLAVRDLDKTMAAVLPRLRLGAVAGLRPRAAGPPPHGAARTTGALRAARR